MTAAAMLTRLGRVDTWGRRVTHEKLRAREVGERRGLSGWRGWGLDEGLYCAQRPTTSPRRKANAAATMAKDQGRETRCQTSPTSGDAAPETWRVGLAMAGEAVIARRRDGEASSRETHNCIVAGGWGRKAGRGSGSGREAGGMWRGRSQVRAPLDGCHAGSYLQRLTLRPAQSRWL